MKMREFTGKWVPIHTYGQNKVFVAWELTYKCDKCIEYYGQDYEFVASAFAYKWETIQLYQQNKVFDAWELIFKSDSWWYCCKTLDLKS